VALVDINWRPSNKDLRIFAILLMCFGVIVAAMMAFKSGHTSAAAWVLTVTGGLGLLGVGSPRAIYPLYLVWMTLAFPIGWTVSHVMMAIVFYLVLTPIGFIMRLCGRDPMHRRRDRSATTYWTPRTPSRDVKRYFRQF